MPRRLRQAAGGYVYHVLNRAVGRATIFHKAGDYMAFRKVMIEAQDWLDVPMLAYCLMPNHWHLVLWPQQDGHLSEYMRWLTVTHTQRWHAHYHSEGTGPIYQGRFKAFPIAEDEHLLKVLRYVERNPLRAGLVGSAAHWCWSSLGQGYQHLNGPVLRTGPVAKPSDWLSWVDGVETEAELAALRRSVARGTPYGAASWQNETAERLGLQSSLRPLGRPSKPRVTEPNP
jgi:putative transposase